MAGFYTIRSSGLAEAHFRTLLATGAAEHPGEKWASATTKVRRHAEPGTLFTLPIYFPETGSAHDLSKARRRGWRCAYFDKTRAIVADYTRLPNKRPALVRLVVEAETFVATLKQVVQTVLTDTSQTRYDLRLLLDPSLRWSALWLSGRGGNESRMFNSSGNEIRIAEFEDYMRRVHPTSGSGSGMDAKDTIA